MSLKYFLLVFICFGFWQPARAGFVIDQNTTAAYKAIFELRFNEARKLIQDEKAKNPGNGITILLENYIDYLSLLHSDNKSDYEKFKDRKSDRIDAIKDNDKNSPYYLFAQAEVYLQWGLIKAKFGDYTASTMDLNKAKNLLSDNAEKFKDFLPNQKSQGVIDLIFGAIPSNLKGIASLLGIKGDISRGYNQLEKFKTQINGTKYNFYKDEAIFLLCFTDLDVLHHTNNYSRLIAMVNEMDDKSLLKSYLKGYVAYKTGHNDEAISFFLNIQHTSDYFYLPSINYWLGNAKLCRMDSDANSYFLKYVKENQGTTYIKDSYQKLAYYSYLKNEPNNYNNYLNLVRTKGSATDEKDKQALKEANDVRPDLDLLKARLYFDGGYYNNALSILKAKQVNDFKISRDKIEFFYRLGRTYDKVNADNDALLNYQKAINMGKNESYYYAANSALYIGEMYEQKKDYKKAADYFNLTLQMKDHAYQNSIDTQAKEGLKRIKAN